MREARQTIVRWQPVSDIPDTPCADFVLESLQAQHVRLTLKFSQIVDNEARDLVVEFQDAIGFRVHWDVDGQVVGGLVDPPRCEISRFGGFVWPLLRVENSQWLASGDFETSVSIAAATNFEPWKQFTFLTLARSIDVVARGEVSAKWIDSEALLHPL